MRVGADTKGNRWVGLVWSSVALLACGGRTLDDGVYGFEGTTSTTSCSYAGKAYANGSLITGACVCFCSSGRIECEQGCSSPSGGASSGGASSGGASTGGASTGGASTGGASTGGASSGGASTGGASSGGYGAVSSGGAPSAGMTSGGASAGIGGSFGGVGGTASAGSSFGAAGGFGMAGAAGIGGAVSVCGPTPRASGMQPKIDDMEDGDGRISSFDGRSGVWYTYDDGTPGGFQFPQGQPFVMSTVARDASGGTIAARTYGTGFSSWGAGMGFVLNNGCPYDASIENGLHFFARSEVGTTWINVLLATSATTPTTNHGTCVLTTNTACYDAYQTLIVIGTDWSEVFVPYGLLTQQGWGTPVPFDPRTLMGVNFQTMLGNGSLFSFSIDSVSFY